MSKVQTYSLAKDGNTSLSANFKVREFASKDGADTILIDLDLVDILQKIRNHFGAAVTINSAYRTPAHNAAVGGTGSSYHVKGQAADIVVVGVNPSEAAKYAESINVLGIGLYTASAFTHVDTRTVKYYWTNSGSGNVTTATFGGSSSSGGSSSGGSSSGSSSSSSKILEAQKGLNSRYSFGLAQDGIAGPATKSALIKAYQTELNKQYSKGLAVDGIWGPKTQAAAVIVLKNASGNLTFVLQAALAIQGYNPGTLDGKFGDNTYTALQSFQKAKGLTVDGRAGAQTWAALLGKL